MQHALLYHESNATAAEAVRFLPAVLHRVARSIIGHLGVSRVAYIAEGAPTVGPPAAQGIRPATNPQLQRARHDPAAQAENLRRREQQIERGEAD
eukprot:9260515-Alexandrium_andersonii.AAC.1